jgi:hypothetical protein
LELRNVGEPVEQRNISLKGILIPASILWMTTTFWVGFTQLSYRLPQIRPQEIGDVVFKLIQSKFKRGQHVREHVVV